MGFIAKTKEKFIQRKTESLKRQKVVEGGLAKANAAYQKEQRDVQAIREYNQKVESSRPNLVRNFGQGLAAVMNKQQSVAQNTKQVKVSTKKINKGLTRMGEQNQGSRGFEMAVKPDTYTPSGRFDFGGSANSPFNQSIARKDKKGPFDL